MCVQSWSEYPGDIVFGMDTMEYAECSILLSIVPQQRQVHKCKKKNNVHEFKNRVQEIKQKV